MTNPASTTWDIGYVREDGSQGTVIVHKQPDAIAAIQRAIIVMAESGESGDIIFVTRADRWPQL